MKSLNKLIVIIALMLFTGINAADLMGKSPVTLHDFVVEDIYGDEFRFSDLKGKRIMIVNTASKCGLTPQFEALEQLYRKYSEQNFVIVGFPANNFMNQEPGTNEEIIAFCEENYGVTFPMMSKISVKGDDIHPLYQWLTQKDKNGNMDSEVAWNFQKYLINEKGELVAMFSPRHDPLSEEIISFITK